jgi:L-asparaginase II
MRLERGLVGKSGAEGFFALGNPNGVGMALKIGDGDAGNRARFLASAVALRNLGWVTDDDLRSTLAEYAPRPIINLAGRSTGEIRPSAYLQSSTDTVPL